MSASGPISLEVREAALLKREAELDAREAALVDRERAVETSASEKEPEVILEPDKKETDNPSSGGSLAVTDAPVLEENKPEETEENTTDTSGYEEKLVKEVEPENVEEDETKGITKDEDDLKEPKPSSLQDIKERDHRITHREEDEVEKQVPVVEDELVPEVKDVNKEDFVSEKAKVEDVKDEGAKVEDAKVEDAKVEEVQTDALKVEGLLLGVSSSKKELKFEDLPPQTVEAIPSAVSISTSSSELTQSRIANETVKEDLQAFVTEGEPGTESRTIPTEDKLPQDDTPVTDMAPTEEASEPIVGENPVIIEKEPVVEAIGLVVEPLIPVTESAAAIESTDLDLQSKSGSGIPAIEKLTLEEDVPVGGIVKEEPVIRKVEHVNHPGQETSTAPVAPKPISV